MQGDLSFQILTYCSALLEVCNYGMPLHYQEMQHRNKTNEEQKWAKLEDLHDGAHGGRANGDAAKGGVEPLGDVGVPAQLVERKRRNLADTRAVAPRSSAARAAPRRPCSPRSRRPPAARAASGSSRTPATSVR